MKHDAVFLERWCEQLAAPYRHPASGVVVAIAQDDDSYLACRGLIGVRGVSGAAGSVGSAGLAEAADVERADPPTADTLFEIGSITKVFTALLLAKLALAARIDPDAPLSTQITGFDGLPRWITPRALATHTSGLPRIPVPWWKRPLLSPIDPYAAFGTPELVRWMKRYGRRVSAGWSTGAQINRPSHRRIGRPTRRPTHRLRYSNLGVGLLGFALGRVAGSDYGSALRAEVLQPLGLSDTVIDLEEANLRRFATPHRSSGAHTPPWHFDALAGAGALRSSAGDLVRFARAVFASQENRGPLAAAIRATLAVQVPASDPQAPAQCLGWSLLPCPRLPVSVHAHDGSTLGSSSALYVVPGRKLAVIVLANRGLGLGGPIAVARSDPLGIIENLLATEGASGGRT